MKIICGTGRQASEILKNGQIGGHAKQWVGERKCAAEAIFCSTTENSHHLEA